MLPSPARGPGTGAWLTMARVAKRVRWHRPAPEKAGGAGTRSIEAFEFAAPATVGLRLPAAIVEAGVPVVEDATSAREWALNLLRLAAEIEHALMVQYLYAASSVRDAPAGDGVNYRAKLREIAIQEMGHLATVLNLLVLLGGPQAVHLQRDVLRETSELNAIPFTLEPVNRVSLAKFTCAERPLDIPTALQDRVAALLGLAEHDIGIAARRVGVVYEMLRYLFSEGSAASAGVVDFALLVDMPAQPRLTDADLQPAADTEPFLATAEEWEVDHEDILLFTPRTRAQALAALTAVATQGEGLLTDEAQSHFERFLEIVDAHDSGAFQGAAVASSPTLGQHGPAQGTNIDHPYTRLWGTAFSLQYTLVVTSIQDAYRTARTPDGTPGLREGLTGDAVRRMRRVIDEVGTLLASLPLHPEGQALAGAPYDLDPAKLDQPMAAIAGSHIELLNLLEATYADIESSPDFVSHPDHRNTVANLRKEDRRHRKLFA